MLVLVLVLVLIALLLHGFPKMLERMTRILVLFLQRREMAFFGRDAILQVNDLLGELRPFEGFASLASASLVKGW